MSVRYPNETTTLLNSITGIFSNITSTTKNNINPDGIVVLDEDEDTTHGVADGESPYELETPLADAMDNANSTGPVENQAEELFDNVLSGSNETNSIDFSSGSSVLYNS